MRTGFDNDKYIELQAEHIRERVGQFGGKLYLEFGGKLFDDYHASRVLPGFEPDSQVPHAQEHRGRRRGHHRHQRQPHREEQVPRRPRHHLRRGRPAPGGPLPRQRHGRGGRGHHPVRRPARGRRLPPPPGGPGHPVPPALPHRRATPTTWTLIVSDEGYGKNEYVETTRPLVVVTAPGPGSGKLATCLSQIYHEHKRGVEAGYAKFETFPVWNLPLEAPREHRLRGRHGRPRRRQHHRPLPPGRLRQDHRQLQPRRRGLPRGAAPSWSSILGQSPYQCPTDMGVNMAGFAIVDDDACREASKMEIVRRYFQACVAVKRTGMGSEQVQRLELIDEAGRRGQELLAGKERRAHARRPRSPERPCGAMVMPDGSVVTGKTCARLGAASSLLMNALKARHRRGHGARGHQRLRHRAHLPPEDAPPGHAKNPRLHSDETLHGALHHLGNRPRSPAQLRGRGLEKLRGCDAFFSVIISADRRASSTASPGHQRLLRAQVRAQHALPRVDARNGKSTRRGSP